MVTVFAGFLSALATAAVSFTALVVCTAVESVATAASAMESSCNTRQVQAVNKTASELIEELRKLPSNNVNVAKLANATMNFTVACVEFLATTYLCRKGFFFLFG